MMKIYFLNIYLIFFVALSVAGAQNFTKIMKGQTPFVTKFTDLFYMTTAHEIIEDKCKIAIYTSSDLKSWKFENLAFESGTFPKWGYDKNHWGPKIYQFGDSYNLYYYAYKKNSSTHAIGVATAPTPTGPYVDIGKPFWEESGDSLWYPNIGHGKFKS